MLVAGVTAFLVTVHWVRSRDLRERYAILWLGVATGLLLLGLFPELIMGFARLMRFSYSAAAVFLAVTAMYVFAFAASVSETRHYRRNIRMAQELAILEERLKKLESRLGAGDQSRRG
jgi:hypothetical protein